MGKAKQDEINEKSKKIDILEAYHKTLKKLEEQKKIRPKEEKEKKEQDFFLMAASKLSVESIVKGIADVKLKVSKFFDETEEQLVNSYSQFTNLQKSNTIAKNNLSELYQIEAQAASLEALIESQREMREEFEKEMEEERSLLEEEISEKKQQWEKEQDEYEREQEEKQQEKELERNREEEEYSYQLMMKRKKETDEYEEKKQALEKELTKEKETAEKALSEREQNISAKEKELERLQIEVASFPQQLQDAIDKTRQETADEIRKEFKFQIELSQKEMEGEKKLFQLKIQALEGKIKEQNHHIEQLSKKTDEAGMHVQAIAVKAIEGASTRIAFPPAFAESTPST